MRKPDKAFADWPAREDDNVLSRGELRKRVVGLVKRVPPVTAKTRIDRCTVLDEREAGPHRLCQGSSARALLGGKKRSIHDHATTRAKDDFCSSQGFTSLAVRAFFRVPSSAPLRGS